MEFLSENERIRQELEKQFNVFSKHYQVYGVFLYGSQNYGLATESSDIDTKVVVVPTMDELIFSQPVSKTYKTDGGLADVKDIRLFMSNLKKQNINYLETLFTEHALYCNDYERQRLGMLKEKIAHFDEAKNIACMKGMYNQALKKYEADHSDKQLANMIRLCIAMERYKEGKPYNKVIWVPNLLFIKEGTRDREIDDTFKRASAEETISRIDSFSMDCAPKNESLEKALDEITKDAIYYFNKVK